MPRPLTSPAVLCLIPLLLATPCVYAGPSPVATAITLSVTPGTSVTEDTALTLQASVVTGATPVTRGTVIFYDGVRRLSAVELVYSRSTFTLGTANFKLFLGPGSHVLKAFYGGTNRYLASTSLTATVTVTMSSSAVTSTAITSSGSAGNYTLNGRVTASSSTSATGLVSFTDQTNSNFALGSASLDAATLTTGWQTFTSSATPTPTYAILIGDLNGDGIPDLVSATTAAAPSAYSSGAADFRRDLTKPVIPTEVEGPASSLRRSRISVVKSQRKSPAQPLNTATRTGPRSFCL